MQLTIFPYDFEYEIQDKDIVVNLYAITDKNKRIVVKQKHEVFFYCESSANKDNLLKLEIDDAKVLKVTKIKKELIGTTKEFYKVYVNYPKAVSIIAKALEEQGVTCYERDIPFIHRFLRDNKITPMTKIKATGEFQDDTTFISTKLEQTNLETTSNWKILAIDIETYAKNKEIDPIKNPILMVSFYGQDRKGKIFEKVITYKKFKHKLKYLNIVKDEKELLEEIQSTINQFDPDIITGYFSDGFDFPYIKTRADHHKINFKLGIKQADIYIRKNAGFRSSQATIRSILHIDVLKFVKNIFGKNLKTDSFSLDNVAQELLGSKKLDVNLEHLHSAWDENKEDQLQDFCKYNLHDSHLTFKLCNMLLFDIIEFTKIVGLPTHDVIRMKFSRLVENYILNRAIEENNLAPNKPTDDELAFRRDESVQGAFVFQPTPGLYKDIVVLDFRSLYPTIITAHNIGPDSFECDCCKDKKTRRVPTKEEYWFCSKKKFIPKVLENLIVKRMDVKQEIKKAKTKKQDTKFLEARSYALKTLANSFYGYLGFYGARWYCIECSASTTAYSRYYIKTTIDKANKQGFKVIYADTDSCFLLLQDKTIKDSDKFMQDINKDLPGYMELEFEGHFTKGIFVAIKGTDIGAKKKYALIDKDEKMKITGFEAVRRNWSQLAKKAQQEVLKLVLTDKEDQAIKFAKDLIQDLKQGKVPIEDLIIKTQITRNLNAYKSIGPHVAIARKLEKEGEKITPGTVVRYVMGKGTGLVRERAKTLKEIKNSEYDPVYYLEKQLLPSIIPIFLVLGLDESALEGKGKQKGLGGFF